MRWLCMFGLFGAASIACSAADDKARAITFAKDDAGKLPRGWTTAQTAKADGSVWKVVADDTAPSKKGFVLQQTTAAPKATFNLCVLDDTQYKDVDLRVAFKAVQGKVDQGGGVVWRYQDPDNYFIARYNPLEGNFRLYRVSDGKRIQMAGKEDLEFKAGEWHTLQVAMAGERIECQLNGQQLLEAKSSDLDKTGKVGLWTKADAVTSFDELRVSGK